MLQTLGERYKIISIILILFDIILISFIIVLSIKISNLDKNSDIIDDNSKDNDNINKEISSIQIAKMPDKIKYKEGEIFDKSGMIVKAIYSDKSESNIDDYIIDKINPLTIYDSKVSISYKNKTVSFNITIINDEGIEIHPNPSKVEYTLEPLGGITRFEIEDSDLSNWIISEKENKTKIIEKTYASGGKYLSGIDENVQNEGYLIFNLNLKYDSEIKMSVSYSQNEKWNVDVNISSIYTFIVDDKTEIEIDGNGIINKKEDITKWQIIKYKSYSLTKGSHIIYLKSFPNSEIGTPNIDYIDLIAIEFEEVPIEPDIDGKPSNDFHTLLQYQYILDEDPENIFNYAIGDKDLSRPRGNLLDFSDNIFSSSSYIIQISSSKNFDTPDTKIIKNLNEKKYILKNRKLGEIIYYRGAIDENNLLTSKIYKLTINNLAPRNVDIPGVDNARDIGGYKTTLIENGIINQGLYFRSAEINYVTEEGKKILTEDLGIKVEIDVREKSKNTGPYVDGVEYHPIPIDNTSSRTKRFDNYNEEYIKVFDLISESDKKPVILHCRHGASRTGIMSLALLTLLGCEYKDIAKDYLFTNFAEEKKRDINTYFTYWWGRLDNYEGETKAEKCKNWLKSKGIEDSKLEHIRAIFIDGYKENITLNKNEEYKSKEFTINNSYINDFELPNFNEIFISLNNKENLKE